MGLDELRERAKPALGEFSKKSLDYDQSDFNKLINELYIYETELEMQNEQLLATEQELLKTRDEYTDLYDYAPIGYLTLSEKGIILNSNLSLADLLLLERRQLIGQPFSKYIAPSSSDEYYHFMNLIRVSNDIDEINDDLKLNFCQLVMKKMNGDIFHANLCAKAVKADNKAEYRICVLDITSDVEAQEAVVKSQEKYKTLFENMVEGVFYQSASGDLLDVNQAALDMLGVTKDQFIGCDSHLLQWKVYNEKGDLLKPEEHISIVVLNSGKPVYNRVIGIYNLQKEDMTWLRINGIPMFRNGEPKPYQAFVTMHDITQEKKAEDALKKQKMILSEAEKLANIGSWEWNFKTGEAFWSDQSYKIFGQKKEDGHPQKGDWINHVHPEDSEKIEKRIAHSIKNNQYYSGDYRFYKFDNGDIINIHSEARVICDSNNKPYKMIGSIQDVTKRVKAEKELRQLNATLEKTQDMAKIGYWSYEIESQQPVWSDHMFKIFGIRKEDGAPKYEAHKMIIHPEDWEVFDEAVLACAKGEPYDLILKIVHPNSEIRIINTRGFPRIDQSGEILELFGIVQDVTEQKRMEEELTKTEKLESIGVLAGGIAHDFNNILVAILGNISLARMELDDDSEISKMLDEAETATERAKDLTRQLLTFSKGGTPIKEIVNLKKIIKETVSFTLHGSKTKCEYQVDENLYRIKADYGQISQVINNIVLNAIQAMPGGGVITVSATNFDLHGKTTIPLDSGPYVHLAIKDEGVGISPHDLKRIFDPFFSTKAKGTGLGLASSFSIIKKHGGYITVDSTYNNGSTFHIYLPATTEEKVQEIEAEKINLKGTGNILIMDDEIPVQKLAKTILVRYGYSVTLASDGDEALEKIRANTKMFDIAIFDLTVPGGKGGVEIIKEVRKLAPKIKVIVSSGYANNEVIANYEKYGFAGCLGKPYKASEIGKVVKDVLGK